MFIQRQNRKIEELKKGLHGAMGYLLIKILSFFLAI